MSTAAKPKNPKRLGRPKATVPSGSLDLELVYTMRSTTPPATWASIGRLTGMSGTAVRDYWTHWRDRWLAQRATR